MEKLTKLVYNGKGIGSLTIDENDDVISYNIPNVNDEIESIVGALTNVSDYISDDKKYVIIFN